MLKKLICIAIVGASLSVAGSAKAGEGGRILEMKTGDLFVDLEAKLKSKSYDVESKILTFNICRKNL